MPQEFFPADLQVLLYDLGEQAWPDFFTGMVRDHCSSSIRVLERHVASGGMAVDKA